MWPRETRRGPLAIALDGLALGAGLVLGLFSAGLMIGVGLPLATAALASLFYLPGPRRGVTFALAAVTLVLACVVLAMLFNVTDAQPGTRAILGKTLVGAREYLPWLGGTWRAGEAPVTSSFDWIISQVAFGMFPWSALAPIAVLRLAMVRERDRASWGGVLIVAWAALGYLLSSLFLRGFGELRFAAMRPGACRLAFLDTSSRQLERDPARARPRVCWVPVAAVLFMAGSSCSSTCATPLRAASRPARRHGHLPAGAALATTHLVGLAMSAAAAAAVYVPGGEGASVGKVPCRGAPRAQIRSPRPSR